MSFENAVVGILADITEVIMGQSPAGETCNENGNGIPLLNGPTEFGDSHPTPIQFTTDPKKFAEVGDLLFCVRGSTTGRMNWADRRYAIGRGLAALRHKHGVLLQPFIKAVIEHHVCVLLAHATGSTFPNVSSQQLKNLQITIPDLPTQQRIAAILSAFDDKIVLNRQMNQTLEEMARAVFKSMLQTDTKVPFSDFIELNPRLSLKKDASAKFIEMRDLPEKGSSVENFIMRPFSSGMKFQQNDTLLARITPCLENGKTAFVDLLEGDEIAHGSTEFIVMRAKPGISPYYVYLLAREPDFREHAIKSMVGTSGRQRVQNDALIQYKLNQVDPDAMLRFHQTVQPLFQRIKNNVDQSRTLAELRDSLLPKLMKGEISAHSLPDPELVV